MKKVGILSLYYRNNNYGGLLQAYALTSYIQKCGYEVEQISWDFNTSLNAVNKVSSEPTVGISKVKVMCKDAFKAVVLQSIKYKLQSRAHSFEKFEKEVPHSAVVYTRDNIFECVKDYDAFVAGSDQIWNMNWYNPEHFLCFVPNEKRKISYAASMPNTELTDEQIQIVCNHLRNLEGVSVREEQTARMLSDLTGVNVQWVLDPTLLLSRNEWDLICDQKRVSGKYVFCYFLGGKKEMRRTAYEFARKMHLRILTLPHIGCINYSDIFFGDTKLYDITPNEFLTLIKNAEFVLTDSFHAAVFSNIFRVKYFVFSRAGVTNMDSRIVSLLRLFDSEERFCTGNKVDSDYLLNMSSKELPDQTPKFEDLKNTSIEFLNKHLKGEC